MEKPLCSAGRRISSETTLPTLQSIYRASSEDGGVERVLHSPGSWQEEFYQSWWDGWNCGKCKKVDELLCVDSCSGMV